MNNLDKVFRETPPSIEIRLGKDNCEALGICHDDPRQTAEENIRYDAALAWTKAEVVELAKYGFESKIIVGGKFARIASKGYDNFDVWYALYAWIEQNGYTFRDEPPFEKYLNALEEHEPTEQRFEIYVPIE